MREYFLLQDFDWLFLLDRGWLKSSKVDRVILEAERTLNYWFDCLETVINKHCWHLLKT